MRLRQDFAGSHSSTGSCGSSRLDAPAFDADVPGVAGGVGEHLGDVPVGVVVGEDRAVGVGRHAGGVQVARRGEDRVFGVVRVGLAVAVGVDPVGRPGRGHELHPALGAGRGDVDVGPERRLDRVDPGEDRRSLRPERVGARRPLVDRNQHRRHPGGRAGRARHRGDQQARARGRRGRFGRRFGRRRRAAGFSLLRARLGGGGPARGRRARLRFRGLGFGSGERRALLEARRRGRAFARRRGRFGFASTALRRPGRRAPPGRARSRRAPSRTRRSRSSISRVSGRRATRRPFPFAG